MRKIYNSSIGYQLVYWYVKLAMRLYYNKIVITGGNNLPPNGRFIFAPNHRNALLDALAVLYITPNGISTSFLARADLFNNKWIASFMRFGKILPAFRMRDGFEKLNKNNDTFDECIDVLLNNHALCIFPEGDQEIEQRLRPLVKGIFRVALAAEQKKTDKLPLYIVPVGLDYGSMQKFGKHLLINIGNPINVGDYSKDFEENAAVTLNNLKEELSSEMKKLCLNIESESYYQVIQAAIENSYTKALKLRRKKPKLLSEFKAKQILATKLSHLAITDPEKLTILEGVCLKYRYKLKKVHLQARNIKTKTSLRWIILNMLLLLVFFPIATAGLLLNGLPFFSPVFIRKSLKVEFVGFYSSIQFAIGLITFPLFYSLQTVLLASIFSLNAPQTIAVIIAHIITGYIAIKWHRLFKRTIAELIYKFMPNTKRKYLRELRARIHSISLRNFTYNRP